MRSSAEHKEAVIRGRLRAVRLGSRQGQPVAKWSKIKNLISLCEPLFPHAVQRFTCSVTALRVAINTLDLRNSQWSSDRFLVEPC